MVIMNKRSIFKYDIKKYISFLFMAVFFFNITILPKLQTLAVCLIGLIISTLFAFKYDEISKEDHAEQNRIEDLALADKLAIHFGYYGLEHFLNINNFISSEENEYFKSYEKIRFFVHKFDAISLPDLIEHIELGWDIKRKDNLNIKH